MLPEPYLSHSVAAVEPVGMRISRRACPSFPWAARPRRPTIFRAISLLAGAEIEPAIMRADGLLEAAPERLRDVEAGSACGTGATRDGAGTRSTGARSPGHAAEFYFLIDPQLSDLGLAFVPRAVLRIAFSAFVFSLGVGILNSNDGAIGHAVGV